MLKSKIALRLSLNFAIALLIFSFVIGSIFILLFRNHTLNIHKSDLESRATNIATTLSLYIDRGNGSMGGGYGAYLRFIGDIAGTDVWVVDDQLNLVTAGRGQGMMMADRYHYTDLPENAEELIGEVFKDKIVFSEDFSSVLKELTLTVGVPIKVSNQVVGVVLLHSPVHGIDAAVTKGISILIISILSALLIAVLLSIVFSISFTKPLTKMKTTALCLAMGDYTAKNNIFQNDEIGELADTMDILAEQLDFASQQSAKLEQLRRDFVANVSHELKTPVTVIRGSAEALVEEVITDPYKMKEYHEQILSEAKMLQRLVGELLELSKLQNTDFLIEKKDISLCELLDDVTRSVQQLWPKKNIKLLVDKQSDQCHFRGDYGRLRQMLIIVLDNAFKFSADNGKVEMIFIGNQLTIKDYGIGIDAADLPYIFDRFYMSRTEDNKTGTGLGLAISKQIADRHGIHLTVESEKGQGSKFTFVFSQKTISLINKIKIS